MTKEGKRPEGKNFFSEEKKQKTFMLWAPATAGTWPETISP